MSDFLSKLPVRNDAIYDGSDNVDPSSFGHVAHSRGASIDKTSQDQRVTAIASSDSSNKIALDVAISDSSGDSFSPSNPLSVSVVPAAGDNILDYDSATSIASNASANHDYTISAMTELSELLVLASASGRMKLDIQIETGVAAGTFATVATFFNSTATPNIKAKLPKAIIAAGIILRLVKTNLDNKAQALYSTIQGNEA